MLPNIMIQKLLTFAGVFALVTGIVVGIASTGDGAGPPQRAANASRPSLFTQAQAAAGEALYAKSCASCRLAPSPTAAISTRVSRRFSWPYGGPTPGIAP